MSKKSALSAKNILEHTQRECAKAVNRNRSMRSGVLKTPPEYLNTFVVVNPSKETESK